MNSYDFFMYEFICFMNSYMNSGVPRFQMWQAPPLVAHTLLTQPGTDWQSLSKPSSDVLRHSGQPERVTTRPARGLRCKCQLEAYRLSKCQCRVAPSRALPVRINGGPESFATARCTATGYLLDLDAGDSA